MSSMGDIIPVNREAHVGEDVEEVEVELNTPGSDADGLSEAGVPDVVRGGGVLRGRRGGYQELASDLERSTRRSQRMLLWSLTFNTGLLATLVVLLGVILKHGVHVGNGAPRPRPTPREVSRIAFGSCTSKGVHDDAGQPIWSQAVIPADPDAWIWLGDFAYLDQPTVNCRLLPDDADCVCSDNYMRVQPYCFAGDPDNALRKWQTMLRNPGYNEFLDFMCPKAREQAVFPPPGTDPELCPRTILGTWDDHDFGWNDGDGRNPEKAAFKEMYLDAVGEARDSPRRNAHQGMWHKHVFNQGTDREIEVFLLDERYDRQPKPCYLRRNYCQDVLDAADAGDTSDYYTTWCTDFLRGGHGGKGSCCSFDEKIAFDWCLREESQGSPYWEEACDVSSREYGKRWLVYDEEEDDLREPNGSEDIDSQDSPFCEVLGREQRAWLQRELDKSTASIRFIGSGSVVLGNPGNASHDCGGMPCQCSGDDWDCYRPAQQNLLSQLTSAPGCTVLLTGDYHFGDIKILKPGTETSYYNWYASEDNASPILQVMASGMTTSTALLNQTCEGWRQDPHGLRPTGECDIVLDPNFGLIEVTFSDEGPDLESVELKLIDWDGTTRVSHELTPDMCNPPAGRR